MIKTGKELAAACKAVAENHKTLYVLGAFGWPLNQSNKARALSEQAYNRGDARKAKINAASADTFGFDCCGLVKALLWGWSGDLTKGYGGAAYASCGVPDKSADQLIKLCGGVSTDFSAVQVGELLWLSGHVGVYIGDGLAVECTHRWKDGVQITVVHNIAKMSGVNGRSWTKHGKLPYITYEEKFPLKLRCLQRGDTGEDVRALQILLSGRGYNGNMTAPDGKFGPNTEGAVKLFQKAMGMEASGVGDAQTLAKLFGVTADE